MAFGNNPAQVDGESYGQLRCVCGSDYLHQRNVTIFQRDEDADKTTVIAQDGHTAQVSEFPSQDTCNPSPRRNGLIIEFECEECGDEGFKRLAIFQHKGNTFMEWVE